MGKNKSKRKEGGQGPSFKLEEDPVLAMELARMHGSEEDTLEQHLEDASQTLRDKDSLSSLSVRQNAQAKFGNVQCESTAAEENRTMGKASHGVIRKPYASLFAKNRLPSNGSKLEYYNLEDNPIQLDGEDIQGSICPWERCLVGYFGGRFLVVPELRSKALKLAEAEMSFCSQLAKAKFLKNSDKGTKFFHNLIKIRHIKSGIPSITLGDETRSTSNKYVSDAFMQHYMGLLGTKRECMRLNPKIACKGKSLDPNQAIILTLPVAEEEIKSALSI
ncbi:hypothetical protein Acr_02g0012870 [Actinidia rufa]|uniref:Uncharacterized protein n=1 Tax=Actinidia rufa TaxID=165716 RepID=A0A7J0EBL4_9ERIC|nr:hypothetical protein Acr_02g0012870 [Actinidia rufa]